jgi:asparagine N-glycosylation enzyme membrane subunit Stt3
VFNVFQIQSAILTAVTLIIFAVQAFAFIDAVSHRPEAYPAADKMTKTAWLIILGVALAAHMIFWSPLSFLNIIGTIAALVYVLDVRPAIRALTRR